jgi:septum formation protein
MSLFPFMPAYCHYTVDTAGAYGAQEYGELIIERVEGSFSNVMGLPVERLRATFEKLGMLPDLVS